MKPLTLEEAKANIGKEVYLLPHTKPYGFTLRDGTHESKNLNYNNIIGHKLILVSLDDEFDVNVRSFDCDKVGSLEVIAMHHLSLVEPVKLDVRTNTCKEIYTPVTRKDNQKTMTVDELIKRNTIKDATFIGVKSKLFSIVLDETRFLWINGQWIECGYIDDDFEPVTIGIDIGENKDKSAEVEHKPQYSEEERELRERIAMELLRMQNRHPNDIDLWFKSITGK